MTRSDAFAVCTFVYQPDGWHKVANALINTQEHTLTENYRKTKSVVFFWVYRTLVECTAIYTLYHMCCRGHLQCAIALLAVSCFIFRICQVVFVGRAVCVYVCVYAMCGVIIHSFNDVVGAQACIRDSRVIGKWVTVCVLHLNICSCVGNWMEYFNCFPPQLYQYIMITSLFMVRNSVQTALMRLWKCIFYFNY